MNFENYSLEPSFELLKQHFLEEDASFLNNGFQEKQAKDSLLKSKAKTGAFIRVEKLHKFFPKNKESVLKGINFECDRGKLTFLLGSSGSGKSVLLRHLLGLYMPDSGRVIVDGQVLSEMSPVQLRILRLRFGMLFQDCALFDDLSIFDNVAFPLLEQNLILKRGMISQQSTRFEELDQNEIEKRVTKTLQALGIQSGFQKFPGELSGGMKKRVGLARAIIRKPDILLYDEPTTGLDPVNRRMVDQMIGGLKNELSLTSVVISHDLSSALHWADRILFLHQGQIVFSGTADEFLKSKVPFIQDFVEADLSSYSFLKIDH